MVVPYYCLWMFICSYFLSYDDLYIHVIITLLLSMGTCYLAWSVYLRIKNLYYKRMVIMYFVIVVLCIFSLVALLKAYETTRCGNMQFF
jgi:hypothetical protein